MPETPAARTASRAERGTVGEDAPGECAAVDVDEGTATAATQPHGAHGSAAARRAQERERPVTVAATWNTHLWGRRRGHREELELTPVVQGAASGGYLTLTTLEGEPVTVAPSARRPRPGSGAAVPPSARSAPQPSPRRAPARGQEDGHGDEVSAADGPVQPPPRRRSSGRRSSRAG